MEIEEEAAKVDELYRNTLRNRCLRHVSFLPEDLQKQYASNEVAERHEASVFKQREKKDEPTVERRPTRRIPRPKTMLRPKVCFPVSLSICG